MSRIDDLTRHISENYLVQISAASGQAGVDVVKEMHPYLRRIFRAVAYESITGRLTVFRSIQNDRPVLDRSSALRLRDIAELAAHHRGTMTLEVVSESEVYLWLREASPESFEDVLSYTFSNVDGEQFWVGQTKVGMPAPVKYPLFGLRLFFGLEEALRRYALDLAYGCHCEILQSVWRDPERLAWLPAPEGRMRDSLAYFLRNALADGTPDIVKEAPVDDRNPVDITIRWADSNRIALIEVKWLGASGQLGMPKFTKIWRAARATKGLRQIANYIDINRARARLFD